MSDLLIDMLRGGAEAIDNIAAGMTDREAADKLENIVVHLLDATQLIKERLKKNERDKVETAMILSDAKEGLRRMQDIMENIANV